MRLALYQPDIPQNVGSVIRLTACLGTPLDIIEPCGFPFEEKKIKRSALDYRELANVTRHASWPRFLQFKQDNLASSRLILMTTRGAAAYDQFSFQPQDILLMGRESAGVPADVADKCQDRIYIPMVSAARSFNMAIASAIALTEALRQTGQLPKGKDTR